MRRLSIPGLCLLALLAAMPAWALDPGRRVDEYTLAHWTMEDGLPHNLVHTISQDAEGYLWAGTWEGAARFDGRRFTPYDAGTVQGLEVEGVRNGLMGRLAPALFEDRDGLLWVGTTNGLFRLSDGPVFGLGRSSGLRDIYVRSIIERPGQGVWIGHPMGVDVWDGGTARAVSLAFDGKADPSVLSLANARDGGLWVGTYDQGVIHLPAASGTAQGVPWRIDEARGLPSNHVRALLERADGSLWIGSNEGVTVYRDGRIARHYAAGEALPDGNVYVLHESGIGELWIGTSNGMAVIRRDGTVRTWKPKTGFPAVAAFDFLSDPDGSLWIATDRGLLHWRDGRFVQFDHRQGPPNNRLFRLLEDENGDFWASSNRGVFRISRPALTAVENGHLARLPVEAFTHADGLPSSQANGASAPAGWRMRDGKLWFATANGVGVIDPDDARRQRAKGITLVVEAVEADGRVLPLQSYHALPADTRRVVIRFTGLNQRAPERLRYRYRMVGFDRDWIETDNGIAHDAVYTNLPSGQLRFEVQAMNAPADWARKEGVATQTVAFDKAAPWWMRAWAMAAYLLLLGLAGWGVLTLLRRRQRQRQRRLEALVDARTSELSEKNAQLEQAGEAHTRPLEQLAYQARHDPLTRLANRRAGDAFLAEAREATLREGRPLCVALLDIDHFKSVNDRYGHAFGDEVLSQVAAVAERLAGGHDGVLIARYGGEEFLVCQQLPWTVARARLEVLREGIAQTAIDAPDGSQLHCTVSIGMADLQPGQALRDLLREADERLYRAKQQGRNRLVSN